MRRTATLVLAGLLIATPSLATADWTSLWRNADQRGEQLLRQGDAAAAAKTYSDPRRKAFAELKAGDNQAAARDFSAFDDSDAHYDRGNALARSGKLEEALKAYDAALERDPGNQDARHNRDLVEKALEQQKQQKKQQQSGNGSSGDQKNSNDKNGKGGQDSQSQPQAGSKGKDGQSNTANSQNGRDADKKPGSAANPGSDHPPEKPQADQKSDQQQASSAKGGSSSPAGKDNGRDQQQNAGASAQPAQSAKGDDKQQARQDAEAGLKQADHDDQRNPAGPAATADSSGSPQGAPAAQGPISEQKLAEDQWLRRIPDDPGGLLRRKFMIEHLLKQQQQQSGQNNP